MLAVPTLSRNIEVDIVGIRYVAMLRLVIAIWAVIIQPLVIIG